MILEERPDGQGTGEDSARVQAAPSVLKGCDSLVQTQHGQLQSCRAHLHQQISKELRMRAGAENLYRPPGPPAGMRWAWNCWQPTTASSASWRRVSSALPGAPGCSSTGRGLALEVKTVGGEPGCHGNCSQPDTAPQIGARQNRSCAEGTSHATESFQRAAGAFRLLREKFSHAPSPDMSATSLSMLEQLMAAQAQECIFKGLSLSASAAPDSCQAQLHLAQEAAQVATEYGLVHRAMSQPPVQDYVPASWTTLAHVKAEHFRALAHYHAAMALCKGSSAAKGELSKQEQIFQAPTSHEPRGPTLPQQPEARRRLAKAHLKRAILGQEEALRLHALCRVLRKVDLLHIVVTQALRRSLAKYSELEREDDFFEAVEAPDIQPKTHQAPEVRTPSLSQMKVTDIFHRLGPLSVFSTKNQWRLLGPVHMTRGETGFGFTLRGDSPVLIAAVVPGGQAEAAGLKEGDYIVSVNGQPCKWWKHVEVVAQLRGMGEEGVNLQVVSLLPGPEPRSTGARRPALLRSHRECGFETPTPARARPWLVLGWSRKAKQGKMGGQPQPCTSGDCGTCP
ncbi:rhophilin-1 isoform X5 [Nannospalax galili]|uniref:rhophilin-1 isoform X5 n=1 Tax=Nannospalax galili TaxID=1026970 RepID=UPI00111C0483|nr:rhophilin-1 isoform X5 [Nannospalax galili]